MKRALALLPPLLTLALILGIWAAFTGPTGLPSYLLPSPSLVGAALWSGLVTEGTDWPHLAFTLTATLVGYVIGSIGAVLVGALVAESRLFERFVYPYIIAIQAMPKVALAPLILVWFGFGLASKVVLVALICFFPLLVNTITGIRGADREMIEMARSFSRSGWFVFVHVKLPAAAPAIMAGLQIGIVLALIGAVVGEFVSSDRGVGYVIGSATVNMNVAVMFAGVLELAAAGMAGSTLVRWLHRRIVFWEGRPSHPSAES
ncbi:ABC transporter permease [Rhodovarius crocodyli]|uniref:ABC transporter permease n=1 Tax=Rhodovarius crocodyli TaxID=1979269 RepID=A0A437M1P9_9PROT|nr:ABC transporter permease [Rhodovarius crocodyli]RVT91640.1 ABC transporter permease [Rhodovarius crocodyli]